MTREDRALLDLVRGALLGENPADPDLDAAGWQGLLRQAESHKLLPLVVDAAIRLPSLYRASQGADAPFTLKELRNRALEQVDRQVRQENEFLNLILALRGMGLEPLAVKGAVCRALYPKPLLRPSVDDDLLIRPEQASAFHAALLGQNLTEDHGIRDPAADLREIWELSYHRPESPLYIELHKALFDPDSPVFGSFNALFAEATAHPVSTRIQDVELQTLPPQEHLLFLILHAYKHFLHSGFGLRIVADICLFSRAYAGEIDFSRLFACCSELRCHRFAGAIYAIGEKYLALPAPEAFRIEALDEGPLLTDIMESGLHGADIDRLHSSNITLRTVADQRSGAAGSILSRSLFPPASALEGRYPWIKGRGWLLPWAWLRRMGAYGAESLRLRKRGAGKPTVSLRIGQSRVALLRTYEIID